ncbi:MAG: zf-TFIIB domain-containing protein [Myxococcota bacterium]|nr:zf-TFIIB domain-containing protein [Myxococcota bacterium]
MAIDLACSRCGAPLAAEAALSVVTCAFCGATAAPAPRVIERVVDRVVVVPGTDAERASSIHCPRCGDALREGRARDHLVRGCTACGGVWLDRATTLRLVQQSDDEILETATRVLRILMPTSVDRRAALSCPMCGAPLTRSHLGETGHAIDECAEHGTFFDRGELAAFAEHHRERRAGDAGEGDLEVAGLRGGWGWKR